MAGQFDRMGQLLGARATPASRGLVILAAVLMVGALAFPLWNMTMFAPQYPDGLRLDIYAYKLQGGNGGQDVKEINVLNHYIGMRDLATEDFTQFRWMPYALGALALACLVAAALGKIRDLAGVLLAFTVFGGVGLWSFASTMYRYGHTLDRTAPVQVQPFMPPVIGGRQIANFEVYSYPMLGAYAVFLAGVLLIAALVVAARRAPPGAPADEARAHGEVRAVAR